MIKSILQTLEIFSESKMTTTTSTTIILYASSSFLVHSNRTLLDIIRDDPNSSSKTKKWKHFRDKLRLKRPADAWTSNISIQQRNYPIMSRRLSHDVVATYPEVENLGEPEISASESTRSRILEIMGIENETAEEEEIGVELEDQPVRMSLMALLTENDGDGSAYVMGDGDEEEDDDNGVAITGADVADAYGKYNNCCVDIF